VRTATNELKTLSSGTLVLPEKVVIPRKNRAEALTANLALLVQESPLPWQSNAYTTTIRVGLQADGLRKPVTLESPINFRLAGSNVAVQPASLTIQQLGVSGYAAATVSAPRHDAHGEVTICSDLGQRSFAIPVRPRPTSLRIAASENRVLGYGLGTVLLTVWRLAEDQRALVDDTPLTLTLHADQGNLASTTVTIPAGDSRATAELRSAGLVGRFSPVQAS
jgi:hypothetical protein